MQRVYASMYYIVVVNECLFVVSFRSVYRELLFLSLTACGAENIDVGR